MTKKIVFLLLSILMAYLTIQLVGNINRLSDSNLNWWMSLIFGFLLCLYITGMFAFVGFQFPSHQLLPDSYYKIRKPKVLMAAHKYIGVKYFNVFLMIFFWGNSKNRKHFFDGTKAGIDNLKYQTKQAEFGHIGAFILLLRLSIWIGSLGHLKIVLIITIINIIGNLYPVILQRKHRIRIDRISKIVERRGN